MLSPGQPDKQGQALLSEDLGQPCSSGVDGSSAGEPPEGLTALPGPHSQAGKEMTLRSSPALSPAPREGCLPTSFTLQALALGVNLYQLFFAALTWPGPGTQGQGCVL